MFHYAQVRGDKTDFAASDATNGQMCGKQDNCGSVNDALEVGPMYRIS